ncbi:MAG: hypothetical protein AAB681_02735 [Patescibacteria group bacterium]
MRVPHTKKILTFASLALVFGLIFYNTKDLLIGAPLSVQTVSDGATVTNSFLPITGKAHHASILQINGRIVALDKNGSFSDGALLSPGYNIVEVATTDRFGKEKRKVFHLVAEPSASVATAQVIHYQ